MYRRGVWVERGVTWWQKWYTRWGEEEEVARWMCTAVVVEEEKKKKKKKKVEKKSALLSLRQSRKRPGRL
jgi:hypothetical protein